MQEHMLLSNPFASSGTGVIGRVSGRKLDIAQMISAGQSAIILAGAPNIGKSTLIRYLQLPPEAPWSWRDELENSGYQDLSSIQFTRVDLSELEGIEDSNELLQAFINQCTRSILSAYKKEPLSSSSYTSRDLNDLLRDISRKTPQARYFLTLDTIERLGKFVLPSFESTSKAETPQERGLALLDRCNAIRMIINLIDDFDVLGFILSIESLPRSKMVDQFIHVSADLARFTTITLQAFTWEVTGDFLAQKPECFGELWADNFHRWEVSSFFSESEQEWLRLQAGTHPYLLQQLCAYAFDLKNGYAERSKQWEDMNAQVKQQLIDRMNARLSTFFARIWRRLQEAIQTDTQTQASTQRDFQEFLQLIAQRPAGTEIEPEYWSHWGAELRYILSSEGIVRDDPFQSIHVPGELLRQSLLQKARETGTLTPVFSPSTPSTGRRLHITRGGQQEPLPLSEREYLLFRTLMQYPRQQSEAELMKAGWGKIVDKQRFTQRMYHLRKKLREACGGEEIIENRYGGVYSLNHPEWFQLA